MKTKTPDKKKISELRSLARGIEADAKREASRRNSAYDRYGMDNTAETVNPDGMRAVFFLREYARKLEEE